MDSGTGGSTGHAAKKTNVAEEGSSLSDDVRLRMEIYTGNDYSR